MKYKNRLGGHSNSYHTYSLEEALEGIAAAGYKFVELSAVRGWTEHVPLEADAKTLGRIQRMMNKLGLIALSLSGHSDLTTKDGLKDGLKAIDLCERMGIEIMNTAIGGHYSESEDEEAFMGNIHELADYAAARDILLGIEIHGEITKSAVGGDPGPAAHRPQERPYQLRHRKRRVLRRRRSRRRSEGCAAETGPLPFEGQARRRACLGFSRDRRGPHRFQNGARHHGEGRLYRSAQRGDRVPR